MDRIQRRKGSLFGISEPVGNGSADGLFYAGFRPVFLVCRGFGLVALSGMGGRKVGNLWFSYRSFPFAWSLTAVLFSTCQLLPNPDDNFYYYRRVFLPLYLLQFVFNLAGNRLLLRLLRRIELLEKKGASLFGCSPTRHVKFYMALCAVYLILVLLATFLLFKSYRDNWNFAWSVTALVIRSMMVFLKFVLFLIFSSELGYWYRQVEKAWRGVRLGASPRQLRRFHLKVGDATATLSLAFGPYFLLIFASSVTNVLTLVYMALFLGDSIRYKFAILFNSSLSSVFAVIATCAAVRLKKDVSLFLFQLEFFSEPISCLGIFNVNEKTLQGFVTLVTTYAVTMIQFGPWLSHITNSTEKTVEF